MPRFTRTTLIIFAFHFCEKLLYLTLLPNPPVQALRDGRMDASMLGLFFLLHTFTYRGLPAVGGYLADQKSLKLTLTLGLFLELIGLGCTALASSIAMMFVGATIAGIGGGLVTPIVPALLGRLMEKHDEKRNYTYHYVLINLAAVIGPVMIWPWLKLDSLWLLVLPLIMFVALLLDSQFQEIAQQEAETKQNFRESIRAIAGNKRCVKLLLVITAFWAAFTMILSSVPVISKELGGNYSGNVWLALNAGVIILFHHWVVKAVEARSAYTQMLFISFMVGALGIGITAASPNLWVLFIGVVILSLGEMVQAPAVMHSLHELAPRHMLSQFMGLLWLAGMFGEGVGQGMLALFGHPRLVCVVVGVMLVFAAIYLKRMDKLAAAEE